MVSPTNKEVLVKKAILAALVFSAISVYSFGSDVKFFGLNFGAPTIEDATKVYSPKQGEIVFETDSDTEGTFKGFDGTEWINLGPEESSYEGANNSASPITPTASGWYGLGTTTITLTPGSWVVYGTATFGSGGGAPGYSSIVGCISTVDYTCSGPTVQAGKINSIVTDTASNIGSTDVQVGPIRITTASNLTLYLVSQVTATDYTKSRLYGYIYAEKLK